MAEYYITRKQARELAAVLTKEAEEPAQGEERSVLNPIVFISLAARGVPIEAVTLRVINKPELGEMFIWP